MSFNPTMLPMVIVPMTFLFVLLVILVAKAPKVGVWLVGGLVLLFPILLWCGARAGVLNQPAALPLVIVPVTFLFVLLVVLISKAPKAGAGLIVALVVMGVLGLFVGTQRMSVQQAVVQQATPVPPAVLKVPTAPTLAQPPAPIWSAGVDEELNADIYPSSEAAAKALGRRMVEPVRTAAGDPNGASKVILFQENNERSLVAGFGHALEKESPGVVCSIEADLRNIRPGEVGVTLRANALAPTTYRVEGGVDVPSSVQENVRIVATAFTEDRRTSAEVRFIDKPWIEGFATFASTHPQQAFIIARSQGTCTSEGEANQQALDDARARLTEAIGARGGQKLGPSAPPITATDVLQGGFIVDRFAQSLESTVGKVWRQALLLDVSGPKLSQLAQQKAGEFRQAKMTWARMIFSVVGVVLLISVIYFFLNMATMGYYEWSLRIAGVVLAVVAVISILMVVK